MKAVRGAVSKKKRRYQKDGFDLDLSYINKQVVAMGFPSEGTEGAYRNPMKEVQRFLTTKHDKHYKVYNLCSERGYEKSKFNDSVGEYPFDDHNSPPFELIDAFCQDVYNFLTDSEENIAVIHCKAGKGRTGLMICCYLLFTAEWTSAPDAMSFYAAMRTYNQKGVTIPSQIRYIHYYAEHTDRGEKYVQNPVLLHRFEMKPLPKGEAANELTLKISVGKTEIFKSKDCSIRKMHDEETSCTFDDCFQAGLPICGDIQFTVTNKKDKLLACWINTAFIPDELYVLTKSELDKNNKDKHHKITDADFRVEFKIQFLEDRKTRKKKTSMGDAASSNALMHSMLDSYPSLMNL